MAAALSSVGLEAAAGGTAISKLMIDMQSSASIAGETGEMLEKTGMSVRELEMLADTSSQEFKALANELNYTSTELKNLVEQRAQLEKFAEIAGMTADQFVDAFGKDAAGTISEFFKGLGNGSESAISILNELGIEETRLRDTMLRLANASDLFAQAQNSASVAWENNIALTNEASKRYETTESKIAMLGNAFNDLKVSVGDVFSDTVNNMVEWLTDITLAASDFVKENPKIVEALGVLAGAIAGIGIAVAGAMAITSLISTLSGMGAVVGIVTAVSGAIGALVTAVGLMSFDEEVESVKELTTALTAAKDGFGEADKTLSDTASNIAATTNTVDKYVDKLEKLERARLENADVQAEYAQTVKKLNTLIPELNLQIDETTGAVEGGTAAIRDQIDAWKEAAEAQAYYAAYQSKLDLLVAAELEVDINKQKLSEIEAEMDRQQAIIDASYGSKEYLTNTLGLEFESDDALWEYRKSTAEAADVALEKYKELEQAYNNAAAAVTESETVLPDLQMQLDAAESFLNIATQVQEAAPRVEASLQELAAAVFDGSMTLEEAQAQYGFAVDDIIAELQKLEEEQARADQMARFDNAIESVQALETAYQTALTAAVEQVDKQFSLISDLPAKLDTSFEEITAKLEAQAQYWDEYREGLEELKAAGLSEEILGELSDGSSESVSIVAALIDEIENLGGVDTSAVKARIDEINGAFANLQTAKDTVAQEMAAIQTEFDTQLAYILEQCGLKGDESGAALVNAFKTVVINGSSEIGNAAVSTITTALGFAETDTEDDTNSTGQYLVEGIKAGAYSAQGDLNAAMAQIVIDAIEAAKEAGEINSPSKLAADEVGVYLSQGVALGIENGAKYIVDAAATAVTDVIASLNHSLDESDLAERLINIFGGNDTVLGNAIEHIFQSFEKVGAALVNAFITGFDEMLPDFRTKTQLFFEEMILLLSERTAEIVRTSMSTLYNTMQEFFPTLFGTIMYIVDNVPGLIDQLVGKTSEIVAAATEMLLAIIETIHDYGDLLRDAGAIIADRIIEGFREDEEAVREFIQWAILLLIEQISSDESQSLFSQAINIILSNVERVIEMEAEKLADSGSLIVQHMADGIEKQIEDGNDGASEFQKMIQAVADSAAEAIKNNSDKFVSAGMAIPSAIAAGIESGADASVNAVNSLMAQLAEAAQSGSARVSDAVAEAYASSAMSGVAQGQAAAASGTAGNSVTNNTSTTYNVNYSFTSSQIDANAANNMVNVASQRIAMGII